MAEFFGGLVGLLNQFVTDILNTITNIIEFVASAVEAITSVTTYSVSGMVAVRNLILCMPSTVLLVLGGCICIILLIAVLRIFL